MGSITSLVVFTANILGIFTDPFEFDGDYGSEVNIVRNQVFERVVSPEALARHLTDEEISKLLADKNASDKEIQNARFCLIEEAILAETCYGPTFSQLISPELIEAIKQKQTDLESVGFSRDDLRNILAFLDKFQDQKAFRFLRNHPPILMNLDKTLRDQAARNGLPFDLPVLGSTKMLPSTRPTELKLALLETVFTQQTLESTKPRCTVVDALNQLEPGSLVAYLSEDAVNADLNAFTSPAGQAFFFWMYHSLNLHLIAEKPSLVDQVNKVKQTFANTLGNSQARAKQFKDNLIAAGADVVFTQESDALVPQLLTEDGLFLPIDKQNPQDGTFVFLRSDRWDSHYEIITIDGYEGFLTGKINLVLATRKDNGMRFLLAACHGHSTRAEDGRLQIDLIMKKHHELSDGTLQLLIGTDANTKTEDDVKLFLEQADALGLISTHVGPTTIKKRMVTVQHSKAGRFAQDEEDYLLTLKQEHNGQGTFHKVTVGYDLPPADIHIPLPHIHNPSDHYPVGAIWGE